MFHVLVAVIALGSTACGDRCDRLCADLGYRLSECRETGAWTDFGVRSRSEYTAGCQSDWELLRSDLHGWEIEVALNECGDGISVLETLSCDEVAELYSVSE